MHSHAHSSHAPEGQRHASIRGHLSPHSPHHGHIKVADEGNQRKIRLAIFLTTGYMLVEVVGGYLSNSVALMADAAHMLTDAVALMLAWWGFYMGQKPANPQMTYGYQRFQVLMAFLNGVFLLVVVAGIFAFALYRLLHPQEVLGITMFAIAVVGLMVNLLVFFILESGDQDNLNMRGATLHFLGDTLGSVAVIAGAIVIYFWGWNWIDPLLSMLVAVIIARGAWRLTQESAHILLEGAPHLIDMQQLSEDLVKAFPFLEEIHHIHLWSIAEDQVVATLHAKTHAENIHEENLAQIKMYLNDHHGVHHATIQLESKGEAGKYGPHDLVAGG